MMPRRFGSAMPASITTKRAQVSRSRTPSWRSAPLSRLTKRLPKPDEPRTLGAKTPMPRASSAW